MKKLLAILLTLAMCIPCFGATSLPASAIVSPHVYMIVTNPGEDMNTQMNVGWHSDFTYTNCFVEYTTADDTSFANATKVNGSYDDDDYLWFMDRSTTNAIGPEFHTTPFLNYGAELDGLTPDTDYIYRICDGEGAYSETYAFKTAGQDEFSILWLSDMHLDRNSAKEAKYQSSIDYVSALAKYDIGLYFNTGDVVASGDRYNYWQYLYDFDIMKNVTYAATVGNHDLFDSMMDDDPNYTSFWASSEYFRIAANYPDNGYTQTSARISNYLNNHLYSDFISQPANKLVLMDEGTLTGKKISGAYEDTNGRAYWFIYNRILFIVFDYYAMTYNAEIGNAFNWAYDIIDANKGNYDYLFCTEHLNIWWGDSGTSRYYDRYQAFLDNANVDVFFAGDNHIYFRSHSLVGGEVNTDPEKGTYFLQAPAITNTSTYGHASGPSGVGANCYADADYLGGVMIDVDSDGLHFTVATATGDGSNYSVYEKFDLPKKVRYADATQGIYKLSTDMPLYETTDVTSTVLETIPAGSEVEVYEANGIWGKIRYNNRSGWTRLANVELLDEVDNPSSYPSYALTGGYNAKYTAEGLYAYTPAYGATIANGGWSFAYNTVWIATEQEDGTYIITEINAESGVPKKDTPTSDTTVVLMGGSGTSAELADTLILGYQFTLDWAQGEIHSVGEFEQEDDGEDSSSEEETSDEPSSSEETSDDISSDEETSDDISSDEETSDAASSDEETSDIASSEETSDDASSDDASSEDSSEDDSSEDVADVAYGDVNGDGQINSLDAAQTLKHDAKLITLDDAALTAADVNGDGEVNSLDAAQVLKFDAKLINIFPVEEAAE
ncbi:MAG: hypothetical protein E7597_01245 [Ruminococcaceae bacterium]|nr:hypothetical protein [Oscillospiraceae bacterium]